MYVCMLRVLFQDGVGTHPSPPVQVFQQSIALCGFVTPAHIVALPFWSILVSNLEPLEYAILVLVFSPEEFLLVPSNHVVGSWCDFDAIYVNDS